LQVAEVKEWLSRGLAAARAVDNGQTLEDCLALEKKFSDFAAGVRASMHLVSSVSDMTKDLIAKGHSAHAKLREMSDAVTRQWQELQAALVAREQALSVAREIHRFDRGADEMVEWIGEKEVCAVCMCVCACVRACMYVCVCAFGRS
jgi:hypothetical protein